MNLLHTNPTWRVTRHAGILCVLTLLVTGAAFAETAAPDQSAAAAQVIAFEQKMELAMLHGDVAYLDKIIPADFVFTHGDGWTKGGAPLKVDNRASWLATLAKAPYVKRDLDSVKVEMHGDIAITYGRFTANSSPACRTSAISPFGSSVFTPSGTDNGNTSRTAP